MTPSVEVFAGTWICALRGLRKMMRDTWRISIVFPDYVCMWPISRGPSRWSTILPILLISHLRLYSSLFMCCLEHSPHTGWKHCSLLKQRTPNLWESTSSLLKNQLPGNWKKYSTPPAKQSWRCYCPISCTTAAIRSLISWLMSNCSTIPMCT